MAGEGADGEVAVRGEGVEAGRAVVVGAGGGGEPGAQEPGKASGGRRVGAAVERAVAGGATRLKAHDEPGEHWVVMQDPEGNEFCLH